MKEAERLGSFLLCYVRRDTMTKVIAKPDKDGKLYITLYGTKYEVVIENEKVKPKEENKSPESK